MAEQEKLLEGPERMPTGKQESVRLGPAKLRTANREQKTMAIVDEEEPIGQDHKARAIWHLTGKLDLSRFSEAVRSEQGSAGRAAWDPRLLVSVWVYAYSEQIGSAREIERSMEYEPGLQWLSGLAAIDRHTLSDFRVEHKAALDELFTRLPTLLEGAGMLDLERSMVDGTKIRAQAGASSFRRRETIDRRLEQARALVRQMGDPREDRPSRREAARRRAAREQVERLEEALTELAAVEKSKHGEQKKQAARASITEPEARVMKDGQGGFAPSYNAQIATEATHKIIVGAALTQAASDSGQLLPAVERVEASLGRKPEQVVADGGYTNRENIAGMSEREIDFIGSLGDRQGRRDAALKTLGIAPDFSASAFVAIEAGAALCCPAGQRLEHARQSRKGGVVYRQYRAEAHQCQGCAFQPQCNPAGHGKNRFAAGRKTGSTRLCRQNGHPRS